MKNDVEKVLVEKTSQLMELEKEILDDIRKGLVQAIIDDEISTYNELKSEIKSIIVEHPTLKICNNRVRRIVQKISSESSGGPIDDYIEKQKQQEKRELNEARLYLKNRMEIGKLSQSDYTYMTQLFDRIEKERYWEWDADIMADEMRDDLTASKFFASYMKRRFMTSSLITGISLPDALSLYILEARNCFASTMYISACCLCRCVLELAIKDISIRKGKMKQDAGKTSFLERRTLEEMINHVAEGTLRVRLQEVRKETNAIIHEGRRIEESEAERIFNDTIDVIQKLYSVHGF